MRNALLLGAAIVSGLFMWLFDAVDYDGFGTYFYGQIPLAIVVWVLTALRRRPWAAVIAGTLGALLPLACPACVVALVSLASRGLNRWTLAGCVGTLISGCLSMFLAPDLEAPYVDDIQWGLVASLSVIAACLVIGHYRHQAIELARSDERTRIARDMHDALSHRMSLIAIYAGSVDKHPEAAETIKQQAQLANEDLRSVLTMLRSERDPRESLRSLVDEARAAGQDVTLTVVAEPETQTAEAHLLNRTLTEGLTNARKHAPGCPVEVTVDKKGLVIRTVGIPHRVGRGTGLGLVGIRERARLVGATVSVDQGADHVLEVRLKP